ncbi:MAG: iron chaperone [Chloroflexota bacterium]
MTEPTNVDDYIAALPADRRAAMETLRTTIRGAAPDATEVIMYKMPGFKRNGRFLVSYDAFKGHYSLFPSSDPIVDALGDRIRPYLAGKGTIRFPADRPIPTDLVTEIVKIRVAENEAESRG